MKSLGALAIGILAAIFGGGLQDKYRAPGGGAPPPAPDVQLPEVYRAPGGSAGGSVGGGSGLGTPGAPPVTPAAGLPEVFKAGGSGTGAPRIPSGDIAVRTTILTTPPPAPSPEALPDPVRSSITRKKSTGWTWPGGIVSREPTEEEKQSGIGCPEIPGIWTYPGESFQDTRYCTNAACPSNNWETMPDGTRLSPTPAQLEDQGFDQPAGKRWFCRVCRTYQV